MLQAAAGPPLLGEALLGETVTLEMEPRHWEVPEGDQDLSQVASGEEDSAWRMALQLHHRPAIGQRPLQHGLEEERFTARRRRLRGWRHGAVG